MVAGVLDGAVCDDDEGGSAGSEDPATGTGTGTDVDESSSSLGEGATGTGAVTTSWDVVVDWEPLPKPLPWLCQARLRR
jgi:hypothetical protein